MRRSILHHLRHRSYIHIYIYIYIFACVYIYIYREIYRYIHTERERERATQVTQIMHSYIKELLLGSGSLCLNTAKPQTQKFNSMLLVDII